jgi:hypothetical protein
MKALSKRRHYIKIEDMPVFARKKGIDRRFNLSDPAELEEFRAILRACPPIIIYKEAK